MTWPAARHSEPASLSGTFLQSKEGCRKRVPLGPVRASWPAPMSVANPKLQALVYNILPSTTAVFSYAIGSSADSFLLGAQTAVSLLQTTQIIMIRRFITDSGLYWVAQFTPAQMKAKSFESRWSELFHYPAGVEASHQCYVRAWALGCFQSYQYPNSKQWFTTYFLQEAGAGKRCSECDQYPNSKHWFTTWCRKAMLGVWADPWPHTPRIAFWHLPPNSARIGYGRIFFNFVLCPRKRAPEGALFISAQLSIDARRRPPKGSGTKMTVPKQSSAHSAPNKPYGFCGR